MYTNIFHFDTEKGSILVEAELCRWVKNLFNPLPESQSSITSGGSESIFVAMFCYREYAKKYLNILKPELIANESIHPAWIKAAKYLGFKVRMIKIDEETGTSSLK